MFALMQSCPNTFQFSHQTELRKSILLGKFELSCYLWGRWSKQTSLFALQYISCGFSRVSLLCSQEKSKAITFLGNRKVMWRLSTDLRELRLPDLKVQLLWTGEINATPWDPQRGKTLAPQIILPRPIYSLLTILSLGYAKSLKTLCRALIFFVLNLQTVFLPVN